MNNILIIRSANVNIMDKMMYSIQNEIKNHNVYFLVQQNSLAVFKERYKKIKIKFIIMENGVFDYNKYLKNDKLKEELQKSEFDKVYLPSSVEGFYGFDSFNKMIKRIKCKEIVYFNCYEIMVTIKRSILRNLLGDKFYDIIYFLLLLCTLGYSYIINSFILLYRKICYKYE